MNINATLDAIKMLDDARHALHTSDAITGILYRAARKLDAEVRAYLTGEK